MPVKYGNRLRKLMGLSLASFRALNATVYTVMLVSCDIK
jgi:hypothetical protein